MASRWPLWLALLVALAGCSGPVTETPTPAEPDVLVTSPALEPLVTGWLKDYAASHGPLTFDLDVRAPSADLGPAETRIQGIPPVAMAFASPVGREAVVVIVHPDVTKRDFSLTELADVFSGRTRSWGDLNGGAEDVQPVIPLPGDCLRITFEGAVMGTSAFSSEARLASTPTNLVALVAQTPGAIGLAPLSQPADGVKVVRVEGRLADPARLEADGYPLTVGVVAVGDAPPLDPIYNFLLWRQAPATPAQP